MTVTRFSQYDILAEIYGESVFGGREIQEIWIDFLEKFILPNIQDKSHILDLCCGRGKLSQYLKNKGYKVIGIDGSERMLDYARENTPGVEFIAGDARFFEFPPTFHAIISADNSFSYTLNLEEMKSIFQHAWNALLDNGWFAFDLGQEEGYETFVEQNSWGRAEFTDDYAGIERHDYNPQTKIYRSDGVLFTLIDGSWQRLDKTFLQKAYSPPQIQSLLEEVGFKEIKMYNGGQDLKFNELDGRTFYICCK